MQADGGDASVQSTRPEALLNLVRPSAENRWRLCGLLLLGGVLALRLATFLDYGVTWDEQAERRNGALTVRWYASGMRDAAFLEDRDQYLYGSFFNVLVRPFCRHSPLGYYDAQHLIIALFGFLATAAAYATASRLAGPMAGLCAALFLTLTPSFYGPSFNNPKDVPFAALFALALLLLVRGVGRPLSWGRVLLLGVVIGLTAGVRMVGLGLLGLAPLLAWPIWRATPARERGRALLRLVLALVALAVLAWLVMLVWWPYVQMSPLAHTWDVLSSSHHFSWWNRTVLFDGVEYRPGDLPRSYVPTWLTMTLPEFYFVVLAGGVLFGLSRLRSAHLPTEAWLRVSIVALAGALPIGAVLLLRPVLYDGVRHLLFVIPPLAILAGAALSVLVRSAGPVTRVAVLTPLLASLAVTAVDMIGLHPYEYVYFNRLVAGGLAKAATRFETDYWGASYKEGVQWLLRDYRPDSRGIRVANCSDEFLTAYELSKAGAAGERFESVASMDAADVVLATTRWNCQRTQKGRVVHIVERRGVGLCYVIERDSAPAAPEGAASPLAPRD